MQVVCWYAHLIQYIPRMRGISELQFMHPTIIQSRKKKNNNNNNIHGHLLGRNECPTYIHTTNNTLSLQLEAAKSEFGQGTKAELGNSPNHHHLHWGYVESGRLGHLPWPP